MKYLLMENCLHANRIIYCRGDFVWNGTNCFHYNWYLGESNSQIDNRHIRSWNSEGHSGQLAVQLGDDLADSLGSAGRGWNDVLSGTTAISPGLAGGAINGLLG